MEMRTIMMSVACAAIVSMAVGEVPAQRFGLIKRWHEAQAARSMDALGATTQTLRFGGIDRSYLLLDAHRGTGPAALVIVLHGGGGNGGTMMARWADQARAAGLVVAAPNGIGRRDGMGTWNAVGCCGEAVARGVDDVGFVGAVVDDVANRAAIDPSRIYVVGFSNGGMLAHRVAIALGNRIAAAAVVSGAMFGNEARPTRPLPMLVMHGEKDPVVGFQGGMSATGFVARAQTLPFLATRRSVEFWRQANACPAVPTVKHDAGVTIERSTGCASGADMVFFDLPEGTHEWPGSRGGRRSDGDGQLDATAVIWEFLSTHTR